MDSGLVDRIIIHRNHLRLPGGLIHVKRLSSLFLDRVELARSLIVDSDVTALLECYGSTILKFDGAGSRAMRLIAVLTDLDILSVFLVGMVTWSALLLITNLRQPLSRTTGEVLGHIHSVAVMRHHTLSPAGHTVLADTYGVVGDIQL